MRGPCEKCGSSDAKFLYEEDGHTHCFSCGDHSKPAGEHANEDKPTKASFVRVSPGAITRRGISEDTGKKWGYGYGVYKGKKVQVAQYRDATGKLVGQKLRFPDKSFVVLGDLKPAGLFGQHLWRDGGHMVVITEGELDALSVSQLQGNKWPVVSVPNGAQAAAAAVTRSLEWLEKFSRVVFLFDNDEPGQQAALECAQILSPGKAYIAALPLKDANDMLQAKRGDEVINAIWGAKAYRPDGLVSGDAVWHKIVDEEQAWSVDLPHSGIQEKTHGVRSGEVITLVAGTGTGKSTLARECAAHLAAKGLKIGYVALEESVRRTALGLLSIAVDRPLHFSAPDAIAGDPAVRAAFEKIRDRVVYYDHFGSIDSDNLIAKIRYMIKADGVQFVFLDHISIVVSDMDPNQDERRALDSTMTKLVTLAQETGAVIFVISHLRRKGEGKAYEEGGRITMSDIRGTAAIAQLSFTIIALERNQQAEEDKRLTATVRILKCRHTGNTGLAGMMKYNETTGRLLEDKPELSDFEEGFEDDNESV